MAFRPAGFTSEVMRMGERKVRAVAWVVWSAWVAFVALVAGALSLLAWALDAAAWVFVAVAAFAAVLLAPVTFVAIAAVALVRGWSERAEEAARLEAASWAAPARREGE